MKTTEFTVLPNDLKKKLHEEIDILINSGEIKGTAFIVNNESYGHQTGVEVFHFTSDTLPEEFCKECDYINPDGCWEGCGEIESLNNRIDELLEEKSILEERVNELLEESR